MKIQLTKHLLHEKRCYSPDDVFDVPDELAKRLIMDGHAVEFLEPIEFYIQDSPRKTPAKKKKAVS